jgi:signal recognition particle subunit SRP19
LRRRGKLIFWPVYFDVNHSWRQGRRVPRKLALRGVKSEEVFRAADDLGLNPILNSEAVYSKHPWRKTGVVLVDRTGPKTAILKDLARKMWDNRGSK